MEMLSIIIVNYNTRDLLHQCLFSLYERDYRFPIEVILVDNNSHDGSAAMVREKFTHVHLIENKENLGFARANNMGLKIARGDYVLLLNSDTKVIGDALEKMRAFLDNHRDAAVVSARLVYPDLTDQGAAKAFPTPINSLFGRRSLLTRLFPNNKFSNKYIISRVQKTDKPFEADWVSGACLMARRKVLEQVGFLDGAFFMYWEDADLCFRIKQKGWQVFCVPEARVIHYEGKSAQRKSSNRLIIEFNKSAYRYYCKHHVRSPLSIMNLIAILGLSLRTIVLLVMNMLKGLDRRNHSKNAVAGSVKS
jgi:GT2 family glycosyltransferase